MRIAAFIPARGGSKRLPGKNIRDFCGLPLIAWSIHFARSCGRFSGVYVSTDDQEIATVARRYGATVIERPGHLASDVSSTAEAAVHTFAQLGGDQHVDWLCTLQPTNPLRERDLADRMISLLDSFNDSESSAMTVTESPYKIGKRLRDGVFQPVGYEFGQRSQDMEKLYYENGLMYLTPASLLNKGQLFGSRVHTLITESTSDLDIDTLLDFRWGEMLYQENSAKFSYLLTVV